MGYILIFIWLTDPFQNAPQSSIKAEFNSKAACLAAAAEIRQQAIHMQARVPMMLCAAKGEKEAK